MNYDKYWALAAFAIGVTLVLIWGSAYRKAEEKTYPKEKENGTNKN